jgi:hypothetical protein
MRKADWFIIGGVLLLALVAFAASRLLQPADSAATVTIYVGGDVYARISADDYQAITIDQGDGKVNGGVRMDSSTCKNQLCVKQGTLDTHSHSDEILLNNWIICMPNGVSIEVTGLEEGGR